MTSRWSNPTGGLGYHLGAFYRRDRGWAPFVRSISRWLERWSPTEERLMLVGPSGGYCLDLAFLARFREIVAVDIDPFAPWVFEWRARRVWRDGGPRLEWDAFDYLSPGPEGFVMGPFLELLDAHPSHAVLFCNILGQLPLLGDDRNPEQSDDDPLQGSYEHWLLRLPNALEGRSWATFHDRLSGSLAPHSIDDDRDVPWSSSEDLLLNHYDLEHGHEITMRDHRTSVLLRDLPRRQFSWQLAPNLFHLIEAFSFRAHASDRGA